MVSHMRTGPGILVKCRHRSKKLRGDADAADPEAALSSRHLEHELIKNCSY